MREAAVLNTHAQRRAIECALDVVSREPVAGEKQLDVAPFDQFLEVLGRAGVDNRRAGDNQDVAVLLPERLNSRAISRMTALFGFSTEMLRE